MKKVTIVIPTYKRPNLIDRAIRSCINQTYENIEIIVVDDNPLNSDDSIKTLKVVEKYSNVKYIKNEKSLGGAGSRNVGIKAATGDFVAFLDDDDEYLPNKIEKQLERYQEVNDPNCAFIYCYANIINGNKNRIEKRDSEGKVLYDCLIKNLAITNYLFFPKKMLDSVGGFDDVKCCQEGILLLKLLEKNYTAYRVPEVLVNVYEHSTTDGSGITHISENYIKNAQAYLNRCLELANRFDKKKKVNIYQKKYYWIFNMYYILKDKKGKKEYLIKILKLKKINLITLKTIIKYFINN